MQVRYKLSPVGIMALKHIELEFTKLNVVYVVEKGEKIMDKTLIITFDDNESIDTIFALGALCGSVEATV